MSVNQFLTTAFNGLLVLLATGTAITVAYSLLYGAAAQFGSLEIKWEEGVYGEEKKWDSVHAHDYGSDWKVCRDRDWLIYNGAVAWKLLALLAAFGGGIGLTLYAVGYVAEHAADAISSLL